MAVTRTCEAEALLALLPFTPLNDMQ